MTSYGLIRNSQSFCLQKKILRRKYIDQFETGEKLDDYCPSAKFKVFFFFQKLKKYWKMMIELHILIMAILGVYIWARFCRTLETIENNLENDEHVSKQQN